MSRTAPVWFALLIAGSLHGQAMVEAGAALGGASMAGAPAIDVGKALSNLLNGSLATLPAPGVPINGAKPARIPTGSPMIGNKSLADILGGADFSGVRNGAMGAPGQAGMPVGGNVGGMDMAKIMQMTQPPAPPAPADPSVIIVPPEKMATPKPDGRFYEDPKWIPPGMAYDDLLRWFGPPAMEMTIGPSHKSLMYTSKEGIPYTVELLDGKVAAPESAAPKPKAKPAAPRDYVLMNVK